MKLKIGLPKGSLQEATLELFKKAGFHFQVRSRSYIPSVDDPELDPVLLRAQEIARYVEMGVLDCGLTGKDWILENDADVNEVADFAYGKSEFHAVRIVLAAPKGGDIKSVKDLEGKRLATEYVNLTKKWLARNNVKAHVEFSYGATEVKVPELVDAIVELTETGSSLRAHGLEIIETLLESTTRFVANHDAYKDPEKRQKMENISMLLQGALNAGELVGLKMNVPTKDLEKVLNVLPALKKPTISQLSDQDWVAVETILEDHMVRDLIPELKHAGAEGLVEYPLNKVIY